MQSLRKNTKKAELSERILLTLGLSILSRLGTFIPVPGVDHDAFYQSISSNPIASFLNIFSGGGFASIGIFALGIVPYINASIIIQLATTSIPSLEKLQKEEGEAGPDGGGHGAGAARGQAEGGERSSAGEDPCGLRRGAEQGRAQEYVYEFGVDRAH